MWLCSLHLQCTLLLPYTQKSCLPAADRGERSPPTSVDRYPLQSSYTSPTSRTNAKDVVKRVKKPLTMKHCTSIIDGLKAIYFNKVGAQKTSGL